MIVVLDTSSAVEIALKRSGFNHISGYLLEADLVLSPELFVSEITNVFWKYYSFANLDSAICERGIEMSIKLIDDFISVKELYREAFSLAVETDHSVYDCLYLILARRNNAVLLSEDKKMKKLAKKLNIQSA
jgi:predicted nucleic acid-binding protein